MNQRERRRMAFTEDEATYLKWQPLGRIVLALLIVVGISHDLRLRAPVRSSPPDPPPQPRLKNWQPSGASCVAATPFRRARPRS